MHSCNCSEGDVEMFTLIDRDSSVLIGLYNNGLAESPKQGVLEINLLGNTTYDAESGNRTSATLVGGECSHHCAIPAM